MNVRELRIGNYTKVKDMNCVVWSFYENGIHIGLGKCFNFQELEPIELTEEWFLRFGFKKEIESEYTRDSFCMGKVSLWNKNLDFSVLIFMPTSTEIKYVHQLQNLYFALTGEELTIK